MFICLRYSTISSLNYSINLSSTFVVSLHCDKFQVMHSRWGFFLLLACNFSRKVCLFFETLFTLIFVFELLDPLELAYLLSMPESIIRPNMKQPR